MLTREQIKAARAMLDWSQKELARQCGNVSEPTIKLIETGKINSTPETLGALQKTFEDSGLEFLPQSGVRFRDDLVTIIEKRADNDNIYLRLLDDIYYTIKNKPSEVLQSFIDNSFSPPEVIERELMIRKAAAKCRNLVRHGDEYLIYPVSEYRWLPKGYYINNPITVYGDKFATLIQSEPSKDTPGYVKKIIIINNEDVANVKRLEFEMLWSIGGVPKKTIADKTYE